MKVFVNGKIWQWASGDFDRYENAFAEWMEVADDGEIIEVGSGPLPTAFTSEEVEVHDLDGRLVLPGLHDSHIHAYGLGESAEYVDLLGCDSFEDFARRLSEYDSAFPDKAFIVGFGWAQDQLSPSARYPSRHDIDAVIKDRPVILYRGCWHIAVVNTKALEVAGIDINGTHFDIPDGAVDIDENGVTGVLRESATELVSKHANEPSMDLRVKCLKNALQQCVRFGLTAVHTNDERGWPVHQTLQEGSGLPLRVYMTPSIDELASNPDIPPSGSREGLLSCDRIKIFSDGSLGAETAALRYPYKGTTNQGILMNSDEDLVEQISAATTRGYRVEIHAIGDRAAEQVLMALRKAQVTPDKRPILTHCQILGDDLIEQMRGQGVIGNIQPSFTITDASFVRKRLEDHLFPVSYCWKTMLQRGVVCAGGSDAPIETCNPFQGMFDAIYRHKPDQPDDVFLPEEKLSFNEALAVYTRNGAYAAMEEHRLGQLAPGYRADFVVLREDVTQNHGALVQPDLVESVWIDGSAKYQYSESDAKQLSTPDLTKSLLPGKNGRIRVCRCCRH